jgi:dienelactone hydrolase
MGIMQTENLEYSHEGVDFRGYLVRDPSRVGPCPGILVAHEAWGLSDHVRERAMRLAEFGFAALAVDMVGEGRQLGSTEEGLAWTRSMRADVPLLRGRIRAAYHAFASRPDVDAARIAAIGYCFGGTTALELARSGAPVAGVVSFHGGLETQRPAEADVVKAKILVCTGADDPFIPQSQVDGFMEEMKRAGVDYQVMVYGGAKHSFTNRRAGERGIAALEYSAKADERSWAAMHSFFEEIFK